MEWFATYFKFLGNFHIHVLYYEKQVLCASITKSMYRSG